MKMAKSRAVCLCASVQVVRHSLTSASRHELLHFTVTLKTRKAHTAHTCKHVELHHDLSMWL